MTAAIQKWGNSLALRIPSAVARQMQVQNGDAVEMSVESGALTIRAARPKYSNPGRSASGAEHPSG